MRTLPGSRIVWMALMLLCADIGLADDAAARLLATPHIYTVIVTFLVVIACVTLHYEAFIGLTWLISHLHTHRRRLRILVMMLALIGLHVIEIWIFAAGYHVLLMDPANGRITGIEPLLFLDHVYFSAVCYTTLGLGDLVPHGSIRFLTGTEALVGFLLITWSASFTFFEMERYWKKEA